MIKWEMSSEEARESFGYGSSMDKEHDNQVYYMEEIKFFFNSESSTLRKKGIVLIKDCDSGIIEGNDLLSD